MTYCLLFIVIVQSN